MIVLLLLILALFSGCSTPKVVMDYQKDSVAYIVRDTVVFRDSVVLVEIPKESDKSVVVAADTSFLETTFAHSSAWVDDGRLYHTLQNKDAIIPIKITIPEKVHTEQKALVKRVYEQVEVERELSKWQSFIQSLGYAVLIACVLWLINKMRKVFMA